MKYMITQDELDEIINDTSIDGEFIKFYEMLQNSLDQYSDKRIQEMKDTIKFVDESAPVDTFDKLKVLYEYSLLP